MKQMASFVKRLKTKGGRFEYLTTYDNSRIKCKICGKKFERMTGLIIHNSKTGLHGDKK